MKKIVWLFCLGLPGLSLAGQSLTEQYFINDAPKLSREEKQALNMSKEWRLGRDKSKPFYANDGSVRFVYGSGQTRVVCAAFQVCDIALQEGEILNGINIGDPRFIAEPSVTGSGFTQQVHILLKPTDVGLNSSLVVTTNKRTYHFSLKSTRDEFMPSVSFLYPDDAKHKVEQIKRFQVQNKELNTLSETREYLGNLNFNYSIQGSARWKPIRVYNDGKKTIIEMPQAMEQTEAPALLVLRGGGLFKSPEKVMVNYRVQNRRYIVDSVFDKAMLIVGSGSAQQRITIARC